MTALRLLGIDEPETFRCRVYGSSEDRRRDLVRRLATTGVMDCPAYDTAMAALKERGLVEMTLEPNPDGEGRVGRWRLTEAGENEMRRRGVL